MERYISIIQLNTVDIILIGDGQTVADLKENIEFFENLAMQDILITLVQLNNYASIPNAMA